MEYRFGLDNARPARLFYCPQCGKKTLKRYLDKSDNSYLDAHFGRCNREIKCAYHLPPTGVATKTKAFPPTARPLTFGRAGGGDYVEHVVYERTLGHYENNHFFRFLSARFGQDNALKVAKQFCLGTTRHWPGANVFWQIDARNQIRAGKIMLYNPATGKRVKEPFNHITWVHTLLKKGNNIQLNQCLFGEHQLIEAPRDMAIGIVESEKTAIIASLFIPEIIWMASGSLSNLNILKFHSIANREIILYPDLGAFDKWSVIAADIEGFGLNIRLSDLLERSARAGERAGGWDLADYLLGISP